MTTTTNCCSCLSLFFGGRNKPSQPNSPQVEMEVVRVPSSNDRSRVLPDRPPAKVALVIHASVRFNMIDVYALASKATSCEQRRYDIMYRPLNDLSWIDCPREDIKIVPGNGGRCCTIPNLEPLTSYEVRAELTSTVDEETIAESQTLTVTTRQKMTIEKVYQATSNYEAKNYREISVSAGDLLIEARTRCSAKVSNNLQNGRLPVPSDAIYFRHKTTGQHGYVPESFVKRVRHLDKPIRVENHECYFDINRRKAMIWLIRPNIPSGRFIVRPSSEPSVWALSVRFGVDAEGIPVVFHYKIYDLADGYGCFITAPVHTFEDITQLIAHYRTKTLATGRSHFLTEPFPRIPAPPNVEEITIPSSRVALLGLLGNGNFGEVYKGKLYGVDVAVKKLILHNPEISREINEALLREAEAMAAVFHDNLVRIIGVCTDTEQYMIICEYLNYGSLSTYLSDDSKVADIRLQEVLYFLSEVASGMAYLEERNVVHRDLRSANVVIHEESGILEVKIADFGLTRLLEADEDIYSGTKDTKMPIRWTAPESLANWEFSVKSDVWSFGIMFYEIVTLNAVPYKDIASKDDVISFVTKGGTITLKECRENKRVPAKARTIPDEDLCPDTLFNHMALCWKKTPQERPTFSALYDLLANYEVTSDYN